MSEPQPWQKPDFDRTEVMAIKALAAGAANEAQQKIAMDYIVQVLCGTYADTYCPSSERDSAFAQGRRWVGLQIVLLCNITAAAVDRFEEVKAQKRAQAQAQLKAAAVVRTGRGFLRG